jgi:hypothetical protein
LLLDALSLNYALPPPFKCLTWGWAGIGGSSIFSEIGDPRDSDLGGTPAAVEHDEAGDS